MEAAANGRAVAAAPATGNATRPPVAAAIALRASSSVASDDQYKSLERFGSMDSSDTFLSCNTHPFPSQVIIENWITVKQMEIGHALFQASKLCMNLIFYYIPKVYLCI